MGLLVIVSVIMAMIIEEKIITKVKDHKDKEEDPYG
jgi:hypothetical protein